MGIQLRMRKIATAMCTLAMCAGMFLAPSMEAQAYDIESDYITEEGCWEVDKAVTKDKTVTVSMYMLMQPEYTESSGFRAYYRFSCVDGNFDYGDYQSTEEPMIYFFRSENADVVDTYDGYEIWFWHFRLEPGTYEFAYTDGFDMMTVLTSSFGSPRLVDGYTEAEEVVAEEDETIRLYTMFGDYEWRKQDEQVERLIDYAIERETELNYGKSPIQTEGEETTISVEGEEPAPETEESEEAEAAEASVEAVPSETPAPVVEEEGGSGSTVLVVFLVAVLGVAVVLFLKKKSK